MTGVPADAGGQHGASAEVFWEEHYRRHPGLGSGRVNPLLAEVAAPLTPGTALDLGCGEGSDTVWLAARGWHVTAVDVAATVLARAAARVVAAGTADRVRFERHDLTHTSPAGRFDLVSAQYLQSPVALDRPRVLRAAAASVAAGGVLLVVDHGSVPPWSWADPATRFPTPAELLDGLALDLTGWQVLRLDAPERTATGPGGQTAVVRDTVVALTRAAG